MQYLIEESEVTVVNLALELERAVIQHVLNDDDSIYVTEDGFFPFWIRVHVDNGMLVLRTHTMFRRNVSQFQRLECCSLLNTKQYMVSAYAMDDRLCVDYAINFRDGLLRENFVRCCRLFARNIEQGLRDIDPDNAIVLAPGATEPIDDQKDDLQ